MSTNTETKTPTTAAHPDDTVTGVMTVRCKSGQVYSINPTTKGYYRDVGAQWEDLSIPVIKFIGLRIARSSIESLQFTSFDEIEAYKNQLAKEAEAEAES